MIYSPDLKTVLAVLDWELSTLGDPVSDLAYVCIPFHMEPNQPHLKGTDVHTHHWDTPLYMYLSLGVIGLDLDELGIPSEDEMIDMYCRHSPNVSDFSSDWSLYLAFTFFRVAAILQGVYKRALQS